MKKQIALIFTLAVAVFVVNFIRHNITLSDRYLFRDDMSCGVANPLAGNCAPEPNNLYHVLQWLQPLLIVALVVAAVWAVISAYKHTKRLRSAQ